MEVISKPLAMIWKVIGEQRVSITAQLRPIIYHKMVDVERGKLVYNSLSRELILLNDKEWEDYCSGVGSDYLKSHWFLVPNEIDESTLLYTYNHVFEARYPRKTYGKLNLCTIATTTDCNARCPYCYEAGIQKRTMSKQTALDVAKFIIPRANPNINLSWFGGEPLFNIEAINIICDYFRSKEFPFKSTMVSNGYLFKDVSDSVLKAWNLQRVQITLDGMNDTYKNVKSYIYHPEDPFEIVTDNIDRLLEIGIFVNLRLNVGTNNMEEMDSLVEWLSKRYPDTKNLNVYSRVLFGITGEEKEKLFQFYFKLQDKIRSLELCKQVLPRRGSNAVIVWRMTGDPLL